MITFCVCVAHRCLGGLSDIACNGLQSSHFWPKRGECMTGCNVWNCARRCDYGFALLSAIWFTGDPESNFANQFELLTLSCNDSTWQMNITAFWTWWFLNQPPSCCDTKVTVRGIFFFLYPRCTFTPNFDKPLWIGPLESPRWIASIFGGSWTSL